MTLKSKLSRLLVAGNFAALILLSIMRLGADAYGLAIRDELATVAGRSPSSGSLYTTLDRMERKGLLESHAGETTRARGGRARRYVRITAGGRAQLARSRNTLMALWDGLEGALDA
ncbi:MAG: helix-turn-helix transcriptional regulator [Planctomycetes bacterium]|nr:helix-turn-helix transcriptional regulator [Planctomycetota bacterium]